MLVPAGKPAANYFLNHRLIRSKNPLVLGLIAMFFHLEALSLVVSGMFVLAMSAFILSETSGILRGEQTNYIVATVSLYVSIYNLFLSLLRLLGAASNNR